MTPQDIVEKLRAAHIECNWLQADADLSDDLMFSHDERWSQVLDKIAECIDALVKAGEEGG